jgi:hypothetical protein
MRLGIHLAEECLKHYAAHRMAEAERRAVRLTPADAMAILNVTAPADRAIGRHAPYFAPHTPEWLQARRNFRSMMCAALPRQTAAPALAPEAAARTAFGSIDAHAAPPVAATDDANAPSHTPEGAFFWGRAAERFDYPADAAASGGVSNTRAAPAGTSNNGNKSPNETEVYESAYLAAQLSLAYRLLVDPEWDAFPEGAAAAQPAGDKPMASSHEKSRAGQQGEMER